MLADLYDDLEIDSDELIELPELQSIHRELIDESIKEQIEDPFDSTVDFVDEYFTLVNNQLDKSEENPDIRDQIITDARQFCMDVLKMIDTKYDLDVNYEEIEDMNLTDIKDLTYALYDFFIVHYAKNVKKFFIKYITRNIDTIDEALQGLKDKNDVVTTSMKSKLTDERAARIIANLRTVIGYIDDLDIDGLELLGYFNPDRYDVYVFTNAINDMIVSENFVTKFFKVLTSEYEDEHFSEVYISIESGLIKKFKKADVE